MSLDVYLEASQPVANDGGSGIFVRQNGQTVEITREEWDAAFPGREPVAVERNDEDEPSRIVYEANVTHNLADMADAAGIYEALWRPEEIGIKKAAQLIEPLRAGLERLRSDPAKYEALNPQNGWGSYDGFVPWVEKYLAACELYPDADVSASR